MRVDYFHSGNHEEEMFSLDQLVLEPELLRPIDSPLDELDQLPAEDSNEEASAAEEASVIEERNALSTDDSQLPPPTTPSTSIELP